MKRLTIVTRHFYPFTRPSGPVSLLRELARALKKNDVEVTVLSLKKKGELRTYTFEEIPIIKYDPWLIPSYMQALSASNPDHILFFSSISGFNELYLWWAPVKALSGTGPVSFYQTTTFCNAPTKLRLPVTNLLQSFHHVFSASDAIRLYLSDHAKSKSEVLYPGINTSSIKLKSPSGKPFTVGFFGHVARVKGIETFLQMIDSRRDLFFVICAGASKDPRDDSVRESTKFACKKYRNLICNDYVKDPISIMRLCDVIVLPYKTGGSVLGVAQTAIEAMALGIPVIGSRNDSLVSIIKEGENGFFAENSKTILEKIDYLRNNPGKYQELSKNARSTVEASFNINTTVNKLIKHIS